ncbi:MAG: tyrosine-type recombinase/integrase, partial [Acidobacteriota bacterium]
MRLHVYLPNILPNKPNKHSAQHPEKGEAVKVLLTTRFVETMKPAGAARHVEVFDSTFHGASFGVRVSRATGSKTFFVRFVGPDGGRRRMTLGVFPVLSLAAARRRAAAMVASVAAGGNPADEKLARLRAPTVDDLAAMYLASPGHLILSDTTRKEYRRILEGEILPSIGRLKAEGIGKRQIAEILDPVLLRGSGVMANRVRAIASVLFAFACEREIVELNPVSGVKMPTQEIGREQRLRYDAEIRRLWSAASEQGLVMGAVFKLLLLTGQRAGETLSMKWEDIDAENGIWTKPAKTTKGGRAHSIPLCPSAFEVLEPLRGLDEVWVFASPVVKGRHIVEINKASERIRKRCGFEDFHPHDLRRTAASQMADMGTT